MTLRRDRRRQKKKSPRPSNFGKALCVNCGEPGAHFVPPSFGDKGFLMCKKKTEGNTE